MPWFAQADVERGIALQLLGPCWAGGWQGPAIQPVTVHPGHGDGAGYDWVSLDDTCCSGGPGGIFLVPKYCMLCASTRIFVVGSHPSNVAFLLTLSLLCYQHHQIVTNRLMPYCSPFPCFVISIIGWSLIKWCLFVRSFSCVVIDIIGMVTHWLSWVVISYRQPVPLQEEPCHHAHYFIKPGDYATQPLFIAASDIDWQVLPVHANFVKENQLSISQ